MNKKFIPLFSAAILVLSIATTSKVQAATLTIDGNYQNIAESTGEVSNTDTSNFQFDYATGTITKYTGASQTVNIPLSINGVNVTKIGDQAFSGCTNLTQITIPEGVKSIGKYAFQKCNIKEVIIPDSISVSVYDSFDNGVKIKRNIKITKFNTGGQTPYSIGDSISLTADSIGGNTKKSYKFTEEIDGKSYVLTNQEAKDLIYNSNDYSSDGTMNWKPLNKGTYKLYVEVCDCVGIGENKEISVDVLSNLVVTDFKADNTTPQAPGKSINLTASGAGTEKLEYKFSVKINGVEQILKDFSTSNYVNWTPTRVGTYSVFVYIKDSNQRVIKKELNYKYEISSEVISASSKENEITKKRILTALQNRSKCLAVIPSGSVSEEYYLELYKLYDEVIAEHRELEPIVSCGISHTTDVKPVFLFTFTYRGLADEKRQKAEAVNNKVNEIVNSVIKRDYNDFQKVYAIAEYIVLHCNYDNATADEFEKNGSTNLPDDPFTAYGALIKGSAVCSGYADAVERLLTRCGVYAAVINSEKMNHAWNVVKINGNYYELDTTWMDSNIKNFLKYFICSTAELSKDHTFDSIVPEVVNKCINNEYQNFKDEFVGLSNDGTYSFKRYNNTTERLYYIATEGIYSTTILGNIVELIAPGKIDEITTQSSNYLFYLANLTKEDGTKSSVLRRVNLKSKYIVDVLTLGLDETIDDISVGDSEVVVTLLTSEGVKTEKSVDLAPLNAQEPTETGEANFILQTLIIMLITGAGVVGFRRKKVA